MEGIRSVGAKAACHSTELENSKRPCLEDDDDEGPPSADEEEDEEDEGEIEDDDDLRTRITSLQNDVFNWKSAFRDASKSFKNMEQQNQWLKQEITRLRAKCGEAGNGTTALVDYPVPREQSVSALAPMRSLTAALSGDYDFSLALLMPKNYSLTPIPYHFKTTGHNFPHRVQLGKSGVRQYVVESRILVQFACKLVNRSLGDKLCTELDRRKRSSPLEPRVR